MSIIGAGERTAVRILKHLFPEHVIVPQVPLVSLVGIGVSQRQRKESIDVMVYRRMTDINHRSTVKPILAVRVQGDKGVGLLRAEKHQRDLLEGKGIKVVDLHKRDCPELFKERCTVKAVHEVVSWMLEEGVNMEVFLT